MTTAPSSFAEAAAAYHRRIGYPPQLFSEFAKRLPEGPRRLLDLAAGTGRLAAGFSPFFAECLLVDSSPEMLAQARRQHYAETCQPRFLCARAEELQAELGPFDAVSIGRALHLLPRRPTLDALERVTQSGSLILVCESGTYSDARNPWFRPYRSVRESYRTNSPQVDDTDPLAFFSDSAFENEDRLGIVGQHRISVDHLVERAFSYSSSSHAVLGERAARMEAELHDALQPFAENGAILEVVFCQAFIFRRR